MNIYVGMSGGVDSSLAAALLKEQGHTVTGVYMKNWTQDLPGMKCPWADDLADAKRVAVQLGIDFKVFDFQKEYRQQVVDYMIAEYKAGRTPNPDIMCNQEIKFKIFLKTALEDGADAIATGHYSRVKDGQLLVAADSAKDQTYFLYRVTKDALLKTFFPVGELTKPEVRAEAEKRGLVTAGKKDSQGICFVGEVGIKDFLSQYVTAEPGDVIDKKTGKIIGQHEGAIFYTIGQRHGLGIGGGLPYYVTSKDIAKNEVYVTTDINDAALWLNKVELNQPHWIDEKPKVGHEYQVRTRYRAPLVTAKITRISDKITELELKDTARAITAGQSVVVYSGDKVLGGGIVA
ncbi:MAG TPA: tRNA 2-thiouridine(34) synthase MnmA [Candidatus Saccharimonadales bacterium]|nr:tRNA 2-thiouridine(34) synthase MnmA [Candidatus Saccharimonadales bacterium]